MKKYWLTAVAVVALIGCSDESSRFRGQFIAGCVQGGPSKSLCSCAFDKMEDYFEKEQRVMMNASPQELLGTFQRGLLVCDGKLTSVEPPAAQNTQSSKAALEEAIAEEIKRSIGRDGGTEYIDGRKVVEADFNNDRSSDAVVLYSIEGAGGGNMSTQTLALLYQVNGSYLLKNTVDVPGANNLVLHPDQSSVVLTQLTHAPSDPDCCPSIQTESLYLVGPQGLIRML